MESLQSLRKTFSSTALELAEKDETVVVLVGDISHGIFAPFRERFPERYFNVGILEPAMASIAAGLAMMGMKPIVHTIAPFLVERSFEQLKLDFSYQGLSGMFVSVGGAFDYSNLGCTHHSYLDLAMVSSLDESRVMSPASNFELASLMHQSLDAWGGLTYIKLTENGLTDYPRTRPIRLGRPVPISSTHSKLAVVSVGPTLVQVQDALNEIEMLEPPSHIHVHTLKPFDFQELDALLGESSHVLVVEQSYSALGLAAQLAIREEWSRPRVVSSLGLNSFVRNYGTYEELLEESNLDNAAILRRVTKILNAISD